MAGQSAWRDLVREWLLVGMVEEGLNQPALAKESGLSQAQISKYVLGKDLPTDESLAKLAQALGRPAPQMLFVVPGFEEPAVAALLTPREELIAAFDALGERGREELVGAARALLMLEAARPPR